MQDLESLGQYIEMADMEDNCKQKRIEIFKSFKRS